MDAPNQPGRFCGRHLSFVASSLRGAGQAGRTRSFRRSRSLGQALEGNDAGPRADRRLVLGDAPEMSLRLAPLTGVVS